MTDSMTLSLGNWPRNPLPDTNFQLTPNTVRILKKTQVTLETIVPISLAEFRLRSNMKDKKNLEVLDAYEEDRIRRNKKVQILQELWNKVERKRLSTSGQRSPSNTGRLKNSLVRKNFLKSSSKDKKSLHKSPSPLIFKANNIRCQTAYSDYYSVSKNHGKYGKQKQPTDEDSTKSRGKNSNRNQEYYQQSLKKKRKQHKSPKIKCDKMIDNLNAIMLRWSELDDKHAQQLASFIGLTEIQKKRLLKIHRIEKQKLQNQIENIRAKLAASRQLTPHFS